MSLENEMKGEANRIIEEFEKTADNLTSGYTLKRLSQEVIDGFGISLNLKIFGFVGRYNNSSIEYQKLFSQFQQLRKKGAELIKRLQEYEMQNSGVAK